MKDFMLIAHSFKVSKYNDKKVNYFGPLGLLSIAVFAELNGYETTVVDMTLRQNSMSKVIESIGTEKPVLIGICAHTENIDLVLKSAKYIKTKFPDIKIAVGGPHASLDPKYCMSKFVDFVVIKEGESTFVELLEAVSSNQSVIKYKDINGIMYKEDKALAKSNVRPPIADLDLLPLIKREYIGFEVYKKRIINLYTSRGCPAKCIYCAATALSGASYRTRDIDNVYLEILLINNSVKQEQYEMYIIDDTFTAIASRVDRFTGLIEKYKYKFIWRCESRIDVINQEMLKRMAASGCINIQYGIESGSQKVLDGIRKNIDLLKAREIIDMTYKSGITICTSFMLGHFCDTRETMRETVDMIRELYEKYDRSIEIFLSYNTPFPGTWQYTHRDKLGLRICVNDHSDFTLTDPVVETDNFTLEDQRAIYYENYIYTFRNTREGLDILRYNPE
ncbi:biotin synthase [Ruminiclostridium hungatei]|uniref:Biotin synthase n=1 Tax=Ruminiclostridium hungatei TaxID=48256 RepID=A0A1V4SN18_RUMHU|nr:radical SAM protein [Ruminiclostridium hungatei]OPX45203.1 biotin synthase [Ruminiclostridium hungatei]